MVWENVPGAFILIESQWNLKQDVREINATLANILIESQWNLK